jgi:bifunctional ADP-heptose synthase (sugar kinase/adenylyltransferase)
MSKRVLVVGDVILDKYTHGTRLGISAETPTVVARLGKKEKFLGGAGLVARHLLRLGCTVELMTVVGPGEDCGRDAAGWHLSQDEKDRFAPWVFPVKGWNMPVKHRFFVDDYKMVQYDVLNEGKWPTDAREEFFKHYQKIAGRAHDIIFCDNRHGVMDEALVRCMLEFSTADKDGPEVYVDSQVSQKGSNHHWYAGADFMLMNERELKAAMLGEHPGIIPDSDMMQEISFRLATNVILKMGADGSSAFVGGTWIRNRAPYANAVDTCGAGDAFLAALVASGEYRLEDRLQNANNWAARSTTYKGTIVPEVSDEGTLPR